jgi:cell division protein FtsL
MAHTMYGFLYLLYNKIMNNQPKLNTILLVILIVIALGVVFLQVSGKTIFPKKQNVEETTQQQVTQNPIQNNQVQNAEVDQSAQNTQALVPEKSTVYIGGYKNHQTILWVSSSSDASVGVIRGIGEVSFKDLTNPQKAYVLNTIPGDPVTSTLDKTNSKLYLTFDHDGYSLNPYTEIVEVDMNKGTHRVIYSNQGVSIESGLSKHPLRVTDILDDKYLVVYVNGCYACGGSTTGLMVLNIINSANKFIAGEFGNVQIHETDGTFSYQKLVTVCSLNNTCTGEPYPEKKPHGQVFTEKLPN